MTRNLQELDRTTLMFQNFIQSHELSKAKSQASFDDMMFGKEQYYPKTMCINIKSIKS